MVVLQRAACNLIRLSAQEGKLQVRARPPAQTFPHTVNSAQHIDPSSHLVDGADANLWLACPDVVLHEHGQTQSG
jgi:hypothetical protein